jgi:hypothetical protein
MRLSVRWQPFAILAAAIVASACSDDPSGPNTLPLSRLLGSYECERATAFFSDASLLENGPGTYVFAPCRIYGNYTIPQRRDSIEVFDFELLEDSVVRRFDYPEGVYRYDETTNVLTIVTPGYPTETYGVLATPNNVALQRRMIMDYDADAQADTVDFTFVRAAATP